jgi:hypothetical protein
MAKMAEFNREDRAAAREQTQEERRHFDAEESAISE